MKLRNIYKLLSRYGNYFNSHSIKESLMKFLEDSNYLPFLASLVNGPQRVANIELMIQKLG